MKAAIYARKINDDDRSAENRSVTGRHLSSSVEGQFWPVTVVPNNLLTTSSSFRLMPY